MAPDPTASRIHLLERLAVGGMAEIFLGRERLLDGLERTVVVKRLLPQHRGDAEYETMFFDEARAVAGLDHPHVATLLGAYRVGDDCALVFERVDGVSLRVLIDRAAATTAGVVEHDAAVSIGLTLAETLAYVHLRCDAHGCPLELVHRDLNPTNVLVSRVGVVKLIDFGIARGEHRVYETATGTTKGTAGYMAPEQLTDSGVVDARTDIFALGVILYELFVGTHPFASGPELELFQRIALGHFVWPRVARSSIATALDELIGACLSAAPADRPPDMEAVASALRQYAVSRRSLPGFTPIARALAGLEKPPTRGPPPPPRRAPAPRPGEGTAPHPKRFR